MLVFTWIMREQMGVCHTNTILIDWSRLWFHTEITQSKSDLSERKKEKKGGKVQQKLSR